MSIVINMVLLYIRVSMDFYPLHSQTTAVSLHDLKCPSQYIGLDRVIRTTNDSALRNKPLRRTNYPDVLVQISARNSGRGYLHVINRTSNFIISNEVCNSGGSFNIFYFASEHYNTTQVSTIVQFRAADYGLTQCSIGFVVPPLIDLINTTKIYNSTGDPRGFQVDVWAVTFDGEFDHHTISAGRHSSVSMPRGDKLSTFNIRTGSRSRTPDFPCVSGVWYTFEFAVSLESSDYGEVTLRQDYALPTLGMIRLNMPRITKDFLLTNQSIIGIYMQQREA